MENARTNYMWIDVNGLVWHAIYDGDSFDSTYKEFMRFYSSTGSLVEFDTVQILDKEPNTPGEIEIIDEYCLHKVDILKIFQHLI